MARLKSLCVYCGSSMPKDKRHQDAATALGQEAAARGVTIVFGGGRVGLMGRVADGALAGGGQVIGVIPEHLQALEVGHNGLERLEVVPSMHVRKARMCDLSDAFCVLPGGMGTLDEAFEIITWKQLGLHDKPIVIANIGGFWDPLLALIEHQAESGYVHGQHMGLFQAVTRIDSVFTAIETARESALSKLSPRA